MSNYHYILDAGHGIDTYIKGLNPYRKSKIWNDKTQFSEYEFNRNIVKLLSFMLRQSHIDYTILIPEINDIPLSERVNRANSLTIKKDTLFISIHSNWYIDDKVNGFETHYYKSGKFIAEIFQKYIGQLGNDRSLKQSNYYVLKNTSMPAILTENGFYSNEIECKKLMTNDFQYQIAESHFRAILEIDNNNLLKQTL